MKRLINVIMLVAEKYLYKYKVIISGNTLIMEYLYYIKGEQDVFKTFEVTEFEDKLAVKFIPERITRIMTLTELEDVFRILEKQANHKEHSEEEIKAIKDKYVPGIKLELIKIYDYINPVPEGATGEVINVDDIGTIHVSWNNGSTLGLVVGIDEFKIIK